MADILRRQYSIFETRGRSLCFRVADGGQFQMFVKQAYGGSGDGAVIRREADIMKALRHAFADKDGTGQFIPELLHHDPHMAALVCEHLEGEPVTGHARLPELQADLSQIARILADLHNLPQGKDLPDAEMPALARNSFAANSPDLGISLLSREPAMPLAWKAMRNGWSAQVLVHADLKPDNIIRTGRGALKVIDWETAGAGDPRWDVGQFLGYLVCEMVATDANKRALDRVQPDRLRPALLKTFLKEYNDRRGESSITARTATLYTGLGVSLYAYSLTRHGAYPTRCVVELTQLAINLVQETANWSRRLFDG